MRKLLQSKPFVAVLVVIALVVMGRSHIAGLLKAEARSVAAEDDEAAFDEDDEFSESDEMESDEARARRMKPEDWISLMIEPFPSRDPFLRESAALPSHANTEPTSTLQLPRLRAVSLLGARTFAVIEHQVVRPGEKVGGFTVQSILRDSVVVTHSEQRTAHVLTLHPEATTDEQPFPASDFVDAP